MVDSRTPPPKTGIILPKNGLQMPFLGKQKWLLGSGGQFDAPPPYFADA